MKLNKIIKTNISMNRKLNQKIDNLKIQLEKEKNKNNKLNTNKRGITTEKKLNNQKEYRCRNKINGFIRLDSKKKFLNKSVDVAKNNNMKISDNNYHYNKETESNVEKIKNNHKEFEKDEESHIIQKKLENNLSDLINEKKGLRNNSDCTNFSDANNGLVE